jgi:hypothetical protein
MPVKQRTERLTITGQTASPQRFIAARRYLRITPVRSEIHAS